MRIAQLGELLAAADALLQSERGIAGGICCTLDLQYLPDCDRKTQHGYRRGSPCQDSENFWVGRQIR